MVAAFVIEQVSCDVMVIGVLPLILKSEKQDGLDVGRICAEILS